MLFPSNWFRSKENATDASTTLSPLSTTVGNNSLSNGFSDEFTVETEAGAIAGLIFGILVLVVMVTLFLFMLKKKRDNDREYQKQLRIQRSTKQNAGVYLDTTMTQDLVPPREVKGSRAYASLRPGDKDLYESDSSDEI